LSVRKLEKLISGGRTFRVTIEEDKGSLQVPLPREIARYVKIEPGDPVYVYVQSRRKITIEPVPVSQETNGTATSVPEKFVLTAIA
jgi:bifunctional DNA-binding transcriptional regulator/antitoxin component of YhaV-PrlF toxin-antitoxin module